MNRTIRTTISAAALWGCVPLPKTTTTHDTVPTTDTTPSSCDDPAYGDGTCDVDLDCGPPDIDCFRFFGEQADAEAFFTAFEEGRAAAELRDPHPVVPSDDARWVALRGMLDEGWDAYRGVVEVGDLAAHTPALVLVDDPNPNAFVIADYDADLSAFLVMVNTGLLDVGADDDAMLALMLHELQHAVALHLVADTADRVRKYYVADGDEPIGAEQGDDPGVRQYGEAWRSVAGDAGPFDDATLGGLPFLGGSVYQVFVRALAARIDADPDGCIPVAGAYAAVVEEVLGYADPIAVSLRPPGDVGLRRRIDDALGELQAGCWSAPPSEFPEVFAEALGVDPDDLLDQLPPDLAAAVDGAPFTEGVAVLLDAMRTEMRGLEGAAEGDLGVPWSGLRYFSFEEDADDVTVPAMAALGRRADAQGDMLLALIGADQADACGDRLAQGVPPYGDDLTDEHHATCWRVDHVRRVADAGAGPIARIRTPPARLVTAPPVTARLALPASWRIPTPRVADAPQAPCTPLVPGSTALCRPGPLAR